LGIKILTQPPVVWTDQDARRTALKGSVFFCLQTVLEFRNYEFSHLFFLTHLSNKHYEVSHSGAVCRPSHHLNLGVFPAALLGEYVIFIYSCKKFFFQTAYFTTPTCSFVPSTHPPTHAPYNSPVTRAVKLSPGLYVVSPKSQTR